MIKAILIDPDALRRNEEPIRTVEIEPGLDSIYEQLGYGWLENPACETVETVSLRDCGDDVYVDGEALQKDCRDLFMLEGLGTPMTGKGLVVGLGPDGEDTDPRGATEDSLRERARIIVGGMVHRYENGFWGACITDRYGDTDHEVFRALANGLPPETFERGPLEGEQAAQFERLAELAPAPVESGMSKLDRLARDTARELMLDAFDGDTSRFDETALNRDQFLMPLLSLDQVPQHIEIERAGAFAASLPHPEKLRFLIEAGVDEGTIRDSLQTASPEPM